MRAIRTIIHVWLLSQLFQLGSWRELSQIDEHLMNNLKVRCVCVSFSPQPGQVHKIPSVQAKFSVISLWHVIFSDFDRRIKKLLSPSIQRFFSRNLSVLERSPLTTRGVQRQLRGLISLQLMKSDSNWSSFRNNIELNYAWTEGFVYWVQKFRSTSRPYDFNWKFS